MTWRRRRLTSSRFDRAGEPDRSHRTAPPNDAISIGRRTQIGTAAVSCRLFGDRGAQGAVKLFDTEPFSRGVVLISSRLGRRTSRQQRGPRRTARRPGGTGCGEAVSLGVLGGHTSQRPERCAHIRRSRRADDWAGSGRPRCRCHTSRWRNGLPDPSLLGWRAEFDRHTSPTNMTARMRRRRASGSRPIDGGPCAGHDQLLAIVTAPIRDRRPDSLRAEAGSAWNTSTERRRRTRCRRARSAFDRVTGGGGWPPDLVPLCVIRYEA